LPFLSLGNEDQTTPEIFRLNARREPHWNGDGAARDSGWIIRVRINNLFREFLPN